MTRSGADWSTRVRISVISHDGNLIEVAIRDIAIEHPESATITRIGAAQILFHFPNDAAAGRQKHYAF